MEHISNQPVCIGGDMPLSTVKKGQTLNLKAYYDLDKLSGMKREDGSWDEVMGISVVYARVKGNQG